MGVLVGLQGGVSFPPTIFFKIFTHRPVADMCAFSPRDYVEQQKRQQEHHQHANSTIDNSQRRMLEDRAGWYQRIERNGWRPLSDGNAQALFIALYCHAFHSITLPSIIWSCIALHCITARSMEVLHHCCGGDAADVQPR